MKRGENLKGKIKIDLTRHLCTTCKFPYSTCEFEGAELGDNDNVVRCKKYRESKRIGLRLVKGTEYYVIVYNRDKTVNNLYAPKQRIENETRIDSLYFEIGNYYTTKEECNEAINKLNDKLCQKSKS